VFIKERKMRKLLVSSLVAISAISAVPAQADVTTVVAGTAGAVGGAALCSEIGDGNGQIIAMAACAVIGSKIAENLVKPRQPRYPQDVEIRQGGYPNGGYATNGGYYNSNDFERNRVRSDIGVGFRQPPVLVNGVVYDTPPCDENYYEGQYNPGAARAYCQGQRIRYARDIQRHQQEAYNRGANGY
jgi:hypothetical protein